MNDPPENPDQIASRSVLLPPSIAGVHPVLYHYAGDDSLAVLRIGPGGQLILEAKPGQSFTYWTSEKIDDEVDPGPLLQSPGPPRTLRFETSLADQPEGILIPPAFDTLSHSHKPWLEIMTRDNQRAMSYPQEKDKPWLEIMTRDNPHHGPGGISQFVTTTSRNVKIWDRKSRRYLTADDLE